MVPIAISIPLLFVFLGLLMWQWSLFLDRHEHVSARVKAVMSLTLLLLIATETCLGLRGVTHSSALAVCLVANLWGGLDAVLRFPAEHDLESFFGLKQIGLIGAKSCAFMCSFFLHNASFPVLLSLLIIDAWGLPLLYIMALPTEPQEQQALFDPHNDVDVVVRSWRFIFSQAERRRCIEDCQSWLYRNLTFLSEHSSLACLAVCAASAEHRRSLRKRGRCV